MKYFKNKKIVIIFFLFVVLGFILSVNFFPQKEEDPIVNLNKTYSLTERLRENSFEVSARVQSVEDIMVYPESSGILQKIFVEEGEEVTKGQTIAQLENVNQRLAVKNAQLALDSARLQLKKMQNNNLLSDSNSVLSRIVDTQDSTLENLKNIYLNTDLMAYPEDYDEDSRAPLISGNYNCDAEGEYIFDVYNSAASSGASVKISGLETARVSVSTDYPIAFGNCGLEIVFPESFSKNKTWIVPVPNLRSAQYNLAKNNYELARSRKNLVIKQETITQEDINYQKKVVSQALLSLESAQIALSKTIIKAPFNGLIYRQYVDTGRLVSNSTALFAMNSPELELVSSVSLEKTKDIEKGQKVQINIDGLMYTGTVQSIVRSLDSNSQSMKISFSFDEENSEIISGSLAKIIITQNDNNQLFIDRDFLGFGYQGPFVNCGGKVIEVSIKDETNLGYWVESFIDTCNHDLLLPHLVEKNYE